MNLSTKVFVLLTTWFVLGGYVWLRQPEGLYPSPTWPLPALIGAAVATWILWEVIFHKE